MIGMLCIQRYKCVSMFFIVVSIIVMYARGDDFGLSSRIRIGGHSHGVGGIHSHGGVEHEIVGRPKKPGAGANTHGHSHTGDAGFVIDDHAHSHGPFGSDTNDHGHSHGDSAAGGGGDHGHSHGGSGGGDHGHSHGGSGSGDHGHSHGGSGGGEHGHSHEGSGGGDHGHSHGQEAPSGRGLSSKPNPYANIEAEGKGSGRGLSNLPNPYANVDAEGKVPGRGLINLPNPFEKRVQQAKVAASAREGGWNPYWFVPELSGTATQAQFDAYSRKLTRMQTPLGNGFGNAIPRQNMKLPKAVFIRRPNYGMRRYMPG